MTPDSILLLRFRSSVRVGLTLEGNGLTGESQRTRNPVGSVVTSRRFAPRLFVTSFLKLTSFPSTDTADVPLPRIENRAQLVFNLVVSSKFGTDDFN
jgi:hypothetical protein